MDKEYYQDEEFDEFDDLDELEDFEQDLEFDEDEEDTDDGGEPPKKHRGLKIAAGILLVIALALGGVVYGFRLDEVRVIGNKNYTSDEIKSMMGFPEDAPNTLFCYLRYFRYKVSDVPFVEDIQVKIESRNMLCIEVTETDILGCFKSGKQYYYFDNEGIVQEALAERKETVPLIDGVDVENLEIGTQLSMKNKTAYEGIIELTQLLLEHGIGVQKIEIDEDNAFTVYINDNIRAALGIPVLLEEKTSELANILPELEQMAETEQIQGILHLENYDSTKNSIIFTKEN